MLWGEDLDGRRHLLQLRLKATGGKQWCTQCGVFITCACGGDGHAVNPSREACPAVAAEATENVEPCGRLSVDDVDRAAKE